MAHAQARAGRPGDGVLTAQRGASPAAQRCRLAANSPAVRRNMTSVRPPTCGVATTRGWRTSGESAPRPKVPASISRRSIAVPSGQTTSVPSRCAATSSG
jgi:hypothetical protein